MQDPEEKLYALKLLVQALDPVSMSRAVLCAERSMQRTMLVKIVPEIITGKSPSETEQTAFCVKRTAKEPPPGGSFLRLSSPWGRFQKEGAGAPSFVALRG